VCRAHVCDLVSNCDCISETMTRELSLVSPSSLSLPPRRGACCTLSCMSSGSMVCVCVGVPPCHSHHGAASHVPRPCEFLLRSSPESFGSSMCARSTMLSEKILKSWPCNSGQNTRARITNATTVRVSSTHSFCCNTLTSSYASSFCHFPWTLLNGVVEPERIKGNLGVSLRGREA
jgi:hypothetical protein